MCKLIALILILPVLIMGHGAAVNIEPDTLLSKRHVPILMRYPQERMADVLCHYWDNIDFKRRTLSNQDQQLVRGFINFVFAFPYVQKKTLRYAVRRLVSLALVSERRVAPMMALAHRYLYHENSPLFNEEYYRLFIEEVLKAVELLSKTDKSRLKFELRSMNMNRVGKHESSYIYTLDNGRRSGLYDMEGRYVLLAFYNALVNRSPVFLSGSQICEALAQQIQQQRLHVLVLGVEDDHEAWEVSQTELSHTWMTGVLDSISHLPDTCLLPALPPLFLMEADRKVLLQKTPFQLVEKAIQSKSLP